VSAIWDGDTGHVTITATKDGAAVNLTGATVTVITRHKDTKAVTNLSEVSASSNRAAGVVVADGGPLGVGTYELVMRAVAGGITATYPSADKQPETLFVVADLDAV
jgi:bifunctional ADP-heptose synthase (sugar kinase/adenylyltransferase)